MTELRPWVWCLSFFWNTVYKRFWLCRLTQMMHCY